MVRTYGIRAATLAMVVTIAVACAGARGAEAASYRWKDVTGTAWNNPANWERTDGGLPGTFPNGPGDEALFLGPYSTNIAVDIPDGLTIRVGRIAHTVGQDLTIKGGPNAWLVLDNAGANPNVSVNALAIVRFDVQVELQGELAVHIAQGDLRMGRRVHEAGGSHGITKTGNGTMRFEAGDTYTGTTTIREGMLMLQSTTGPSIAGPLVVGDGIGAKDTARVQIAAAEQIAESVPVTVNADGKLFVTADERLGTVIVRDGIIQPESHQAIVQRLSMTGGLLSLVGSGAVVLDGPLEATSSNVGPARITRSQTGTLSLQAETRTFMVTHGPKVVDLEIEVPIVGSGNAGVIFDGYGTVRFTGTAGNVYPGDTVVQRATLELARNNAVVVPGRLRMVAPRGAAAVVKLLGPQNLAAASQVFVGPGGELAVRQQIQEIAGLEIVDGFVTIGKFVDPGGALVTPSAAITGGTIAIESGNRLVLSQQLVASGGAVKPALIEGEGTLVFGDAEGAIVVADAVPAVDLRIETPISGRQVTVSGGGIAQFAAANTHTGPTIVRDGTLLVTGSVPGQVELKNGLLGGTGTVGSVNATAGSRIAPGMSPGRLAAGAVTFDATSSFVVELNGTVPAASYDQIATGGGAVNLGGATLSLRLGPTFSPPAGTSFTILNNDGPAPIVGTFAGLAEGATLSIGSRDFTISYAGGNGNDVVLTLADDPDPPTYFLAEGATGAFFDEDVLIANPHAEAAPVTMTFFKENGQQVVVERTLGPQSHAVVHVGDLPGLEAGTSSVKIVSTSGRTLFVERTMFWDERSYAGHTGSALDKPSSDWYFAEGAQGFFDTYVLIVNPNDTPTTVDFAFLREGETSVTRTFEVGAGSRLTVGAGEIPELNTRTFGINVHATQPIMAERAMYFATTPGRLWGGGHESAGVTETSRQWYFAEGATGFFDTFILLSNPQASPTDVTMRFLLTTGETITRTKTVPALGRITVNPKEEGAAQLQNATVSTVVESVLPIIAERSMYWAGATVPWGEAHNSFGVVQAAVEWGLAEGRAGGARAPFSTYILLANPQGTRADVRVTFLRDAGAPIVRTYTVPATGRFTIDAGSIDELRDSTFGASIVVTNNVPIVVERSMYWDAGGVFWSGGTNATGIVVR